MPRKKNIFVLMGGKSPEHQISLISGLEIVNNLDKNKYKVFPISISKDGKKWQLTSTELLTQFNVSSKFESTKSELQLFETKVYSNINNIPIKADIIFIAMHGPFGEDGKIQGMLEMAGLKYTGSGVLASAIGMDKLFFRKIMLQEKISIPKFVALKKGDHLSKVRQQIGELPYFVKPNNQGSSIGTTIVKNIVQLKSAINKAWKFGETALVDEYISGKELTCAVLGNENPYTLPIVEIVPKKGSYFDYDSKYRLDGADEIMPARITKDLSNQVSEIALNIFKILHCRGFARVDFIIKNNTIPIVLEINTIPGLTPMSLLPKAAAKSGLSYPELLDRIINYAFE